MKKRKSRTLKEVIAQQKKDRKENPEKYSIAQVVEETEASKKKARDRKWDNFMRGLGDRDNT